jgi:hypothetical protein
MDSAHAVRFTSSTRQLGRCSWQLAPESLTLSSTTERNSAWTSTLYTYILHPWRSGGSPLCFIHCLSCILLLLFHDTHIAVSFGVSTFLRLINVSNLFLVVEWYEADGRNGLLLSTMFNT